MYYIIILLLSGLAALPAQFGNTPTTTRNTTETSSALEVMCLTDKTAQNGISPENVKVAKILKTIKKATRTNTTEGYEIPECQGKGGCDDTPELADYQLVATNIKMNHIIYPNDYDPNITTRSTRQLVKQLDFSDDPILKDRYKNRIYRTFCGDWCSTCPQENVYCEDSERLNCRCTTDQPIIIPYRGSFHCNFIFYLQDTDDQGKPQVDENGELTADHINDLDPNLPKDGAIFSVYFRTGATLPDNIRCKKKAEMEPHGQARGTKSTSSWGEYPVPEDQFIEGFIRGLLGIGRVFAQGSSESTIIYPARTKTYWLWEANASRTDGAFLARNTQILTSDMQKFNDLSTGKNIIENPLNLRGRFEVFKNLLDPGSDNYIYLVNEGKIGEMLQGVANPASLNIQVFKYYLFSSLDTTTANQKSIKLSRFKPITSRSWINKWAEESKPAIYIYPPDKMNLTVKLHTKGEITVSDPPYSPTSGWQIIAYPDGTLKNAYLESRASSLAFSRGASSGQAIQQSTINNQQSTYPYLYYEANLAEVHIENTGKVIATNELKPYLIIQLKKLGLNHKEINDFIDYWIPRLSKTDAPYFLIHFLDNKQIDYLEPLETSTTPDSEIRIRAYFKPLENPLSVAPQNFPEPPSRRGLTIVEWGGILDN